MKEPDRLHRVAVQYQNMNFIKNNVKSLLVEKRKKKRCAVQYSSQQSPILTTTVRNWKNYNVMF